MKLFRFVFICLALLLLAWKPLSGTASGSQTSISAGEIGSLLPTFTTMDLHGRKISSEDLKNKVVLVDFWATWCAPCRKEMPGYQKLLNRYASKGFVVIGFKVDFMEDMEDPLRFIKELGIQYPIATGSEAIRNQFGGIQGLPTTFVYDRKGILRWKTIGFEYTETIEKIIQPLL